MSTREERKNPFYSEKALYTSGGLAPIGEYSVMTIFHQRQAVKYTIAWRTNLDYVESR